MKFDLNKEVAVPKRARLKANTRLDYASPGSRIIKKEKCGCRLRVLGETVSSRGAGYRGAWSMNKRPPLYDPHTTEGIGLRRVLGGVFCLMGEIPMYRVQGSGLGVRFGDEDHAEVALVLEVREQLADVLLALGVFPPQSLQHL